MRLNPKLPTKRPDFSPSPQKPNNFKGEEMKEENNEVSCKGEVCEKTDYITYKIADKLIKERKLYGGRMGIDDSKTNTNLISKNFSPLIVRKYNIVNGWPLYLSLIADISLSDLDSVVNGVVKACKEKGMLSNDIQDMRNFTGILSETIVEYYNSIKSNCVEGVAILLAIDKCMIENFYGDYMNHAMCRSEFGFLINMMPHI